MSTISRTNRPHFTIVGSAGGFGIPASIACAAGMQKTKATNADTHSKK